MKLLYSNILPLGTTGEQQTILDCFNEQIAKADRVEIAVGYISRASLFELDKLIAVHNINKICLNIGMYYTEGMPKGLYSSAMHINKKWLASNTGEIRMVKSFKYHGKIYCFYKNNVPFAAIIGSANLGVIKQESSNQKQYEISSLTTNLSECKEISDFIINLKQAKCSENINEITDMQIINERNTALSGNKHVTEVPSPNVDFYKRCASYASFLLPLKVPAYADRHLDDNKHYTRSNINVCYSKPRKSKIRDWYETQLTVGAEITRIKGYPEKNTPFFVITDDGYWFKAHTTSTGNKQFSAVGDEHIMGRWLKGRLVAAGLISPVSDISLDTDRKGMITKEILQEYGCENLLFKKTGQTAIDENGVALDVWMLSFKPKDTGQADL